MLVPKSFGLSRKAHFRIGSATDWSDASGPDFSLGECDQIAMVQQQVSREQPRLGGETRARARGTGGGETAASGGGRGERSAAASLLAADD
jgi:hypothetical protein